MLKLLMEIASGIVRQEFFADVIFSIEPLKQTQMIMLVTAEAFSVSQYLSLLELRV